METRVSNRHNELKEWHFSHPYLRKITYILKIYSLNIRFGKNTWNTIPLVWSNKICPHVYGTQLNVSVLTVTVTILFSPNSMCRLLSDSFHQSGFSGGVKLIQIAVVKQTIPPSIHHVVHFAELFMPLLRVAKIKRHFNTRFYLAVWTRTCRMWAEGLMLIREP